MMSPVLQFGATEGLRLGLGTDAPSTLVLNGQGNEVATILAFPNYRGPVVTASGLGSSAEPDELPNPLPTTADEVNAYFRNNVTKETMAFGTGAKATRVKVYENGSITQTAVFKAFTGNLRKTGGVSLAVGGVSPNGAVRIVAGSRASGPAVVRLFDPKGNVIRTFRNVLPGTFPNGVNVSVADVNGDNYDDIIVSARRGREPIVTALDGRDIVDGVANPEKCFTFVAGDPDDMGGVQVAAGYVAPSSTPSYLPNLITSAESGQQAGVVKVWNMADISPSSHGSMGTMGSVEGMEMTSDEDMPAMPIAEFRPFGTRRGAVQIATTYQSMLRGQAKPVVAAWQAGREVAFSSIGLDNKPQTQVRKF
jgi:hypothetical protein